MRLVSVNLGTPREILHRGRIIRTGIFKQPVQGSVHLGKLNLDGDRQADLSVHGGFSKAVYVYPAEHYDYWRGKLAGMELPWGAFGENFTVEGLKEKTTRIGDRFRIGTAEVMVTEPRLPCYKLAVKFGREDIIKLFLRSRRTGFYCAVEQDGEVGAGISSESLGRDDNAVTILELVEIYLHKTKDKQAMERVLQAKTLPPSWRGYFQERIDTLERARTRPETNRQEQSGS
jgi:MOSC domain-containing protein YiiM